MDSLIMNKDSIGDNNSSGSNNSNRMLLDSRGIDVSNGFYQDSFDNAFDFIKQGNIDLSSLSSAPITNTNSNASNNMMMTGNSNNNHSSSSASSSVVTQGTIMMPKVLAVAASEHEQQQRMAMQQQQERQRQHMKEQLEFFHMMRQQQQQALHNQRETHMATSQIIQQLLEENNALISTFYDQIRRTKPNSQTSAWSLLLDQIGHNLKTLSQLMPANGKEKSLSGTSTPHTLEEFQQGLLSSSSSSSVNTGPNASSMQMQMQQQQQQLQQQQQQVNSQSSSAFSKPMNISVPSFPNFQQASSTSAASSTSHQMNSNYQGLGSHISSNPHSPAAVIAAAAALAYSKFGSGVGSLSSSFNASANTTPSTSPSWKLFNSMNGDILPPYSMDSNPGTPSLRFIDNDIQKNQSNSNNNNSKKIAKPLARSVFSASSGLDSLGLLSNPTMIPDDSQIFKPQEPVAKPTKKRQKESLNMSNSSEIPDIFERVNSDDEDFNTDDDIVVKKKVKKPRPPPSANATTSPREGESAKKARKSMPSARDEQIPAQEIFAEMEGLPKEFVESAKQFSKSEARHWQSIKTHVAKAGKRAEGLPDPDKWRAWVEITADLPLNNGGPIRRVLEVAVFCAEKCCSDPNILKVLNKALGPSVYKANAAGGCRRMALDMLQTFPESSTLPPSKQQTFSSRPSEGNQEQEQQQQQDEKQVQQPDSQQEKLQQPIAREAIAIETLDKIASEHDASSSSSIPQDTSTTNPEGQGELSS